MKKVKKSRAQRKEAREKKYKLMFDTILEALYRDLSFDVKAFIEKLPKEDRGTAYLAEREIYKLLRQEVAKV